MLEVEIVSMEDVSKKQTNADRIRNMTDEELAGFLRELVWNEAADIFDCIEEEYDPVCGNVPCKECPKYLIWLQQPAKEDRESAGTV